ncbi:hypothetical protein H5410_038965 [Solanum commersonii]|uniref:Uncharacterized protein n=1 Tax=Solanum commersonii TaxID=4109 RepID=A0A9J5YC90_SOLCO|nr:hypothetical protein H5410_038965 [Solanum commersonii]
MEAIMVKLFYHLLFSQIFELDLEKSHQFSIPTNFGATTLCQFSASTSDNGQIGEFADLHNQLYKNVGNKWNFVFQNREVIFVASENFSLLFIFFWSEVWKPYLNYVSFLPDQFRTTSSSNHGKGLISDSPIFNPSDTQIINLERLWLTSIPILPRQGLSKCAVLNGWRKYLEGEWFLARDYWMYLGSKSKSEYQIIFSGELQRNTSVSIKKEFMSERKEEEKRGEKRKDESVRRDSCILLGIFAMGLIPKREYKDMKFTDVTIFISLDPFVERKIG